MSEPPVDIGLDGLQPHARRAGRSGVDMAIAISAIAISVISLVVAIAHGRTEEKLVAAGSWPFLVFKTSENGVATDERILRLRLQNSGVGPARVHSVRITLDGRPVRDHAELMARCCNVTAVGLDQQIASGLVSQDDVVGVLPAHDGVTFLAWRDRPGLTAILRNLHGVLGKLRFEACYCSALDECWTSDLTPTANPRRTDECNAYPDAYAG